MKQNNELEFKEFDIQNLLEDSYIEITDNNMNNLSEISSLVKPVKDLLKLSGQAKFFKATVNPDLLSKLADGTCSTIIRDSNGHIIAHAGFQQISPATFTPAVVFQIMSFFTSQYYLHNINKRLSNIQKTLDYVKRKMNIDDISKICTINDCIKRKINDPNIDEDELEDSLDRYCEELQVIQKSYEAIIKDETKIKIESSFFESNINKVEEKEREISLCSNILSACEFYINIIEYLKLNIYTKTKKDTSFQKNLIENNIKKSTLLEDVDNAYKSILEQSEQLKSTFEKEFKDEYDKMWNRPITNRFKWYLEHPKNIIKSVGNVYGIPYYIAGAIKNKRISKMKNYKNIIEHNRQRIIKNIEDNNKKVKQLIYNKELIYITDNQQNKRLFMKI